MKGQRICRFSVQSPGFQYTVRLRVSDLDLLGTDQPKKKYVLKREKVINNAYDNRMMACFHNCALEKDF